MRFLKVNSNLNLLLYNTDFKQEQICLILGVDLQYYITFSLINSSIQKYTLKSAHILSSLFNNFKKLLDIYSRCH